MITIINYSDLSFALIGKETIDIKDKLKELGGKYNSRLKCGAGWIFSKKKLNEVKLAMLDSIIPFQTEEEAKEEESLSAPLVFIDDKDDKYRELEKKYKELEDEQVHLLQNQEKQMQEIKDLQSKYEELLNRVNLLSIKVRKPVKKKPVVIIEEEDETEE